MPERPRLKRTLVTGAALVWLAGCATAASKPSDGQELVLSIQNLACSDCGKELEATALKQPGVQSAQFDMGHSELRLQVASGTSPQPIVEAIQSKSIDGRPITALVGAGQGRYAPFETPDPKWDVKVLTNDGSDVPNLAAQLSPGKATLIDFSADWCGPCHELDQRIQGMLGKDDRLAYRRINIVTWDSPVARHYLTDAKELPYVIVYSGKGVEVARIAGDKPQELTAAIQKAEQP
jgi:thiol-disulfide isomerase/thioredoxin